jgi:hypothetical protein
MGTVPYVCSQDWDCHGGDVYLHEHLVSDYVFCWQQDLADGEWDAAVCHAIKRNAMQMQMQMQSDDSAIRLQLAVPTVATRVRTVADLLR